MYLYKLKEQNIEFRSKIHELKAELIKFGLHFEKMRDFYKEIFLQVKDVYKKKPLYPNLPKNGCFQNPDPSIIELIFNMTQENTFIKVIIVFHIDIKLIQDQIMYKIKETLNLLDQSQEIKKEGEELIHQDLSSEISF